MYGAIIGDVAGSTYEFAGRKTKNFPLFPDGSDFTDDTIMTIAVAKSLMRSADTDEPFDEVLVEEMRTLGEEYPHPKGGHGVRFREWPVDPFPMPYNGAGNGSAMRVSPCGLFAVTLEEALDLAEVSAAVTHSHPKGIKGAQATAAAIFMAKTKHTKEEIRVYIREHFYPLDQTLDELRSDYKFNGSCQGSVPQSIQAFLESRNYEDALRNVISLGGDADTMGAITGAIAWSFYRFQTDKGLSVKMANMWIEAVEYLPEEWLDLVLEFDKLCRGREETFSREGKVKQIRLE